PPSAASNAPSGDSMRQKYYPWGVVRAHHRGSLAAIQGFTPMEPSLTATSAGPARAGVRAPLPNVTGRAAPRAAARFPRSRVAAHGRLASRLAIVAIAAAADGLVDDRRGARRVPLARLSRTRRTAHRTGGRTRGDGRPTDWQSTDADHRARPRRTRKIGRASCR